MPDENIASVSSVTPGSASANGTPIHVTSVRSASVQTAAVGEGGSGETIDYNDLISKPRINGVVLASDKTSNELHIVSRGLTAQWEANPDYVPRNGEIVVYTDHRSVSNNGTVTYTPGIKVGDGSTHVGNLPFAEAIDSQFSTTSTNPVQNAVVTQAVNGLSGSVDNVTNRLQNVTHIRSSIPTNGSLSIRFSTTCSYVIFYSGSNANSRGMILGYCTSAGAVSASNMPASSSPSVSTSTGSYVLTLTNTFTYDVPVLIMTISGVNAISSVQ